MKTGSDLEKVLRRAVSGLVYISETDAGFQTISGKGRDVEAFLYGETKHETFEETSVDEFFCRLTTIKEWQGPNERKKARQFARLRRVLEENLTDLRAFKTGRVRRHIYVIGQDADGNMAGIRTFAVET